MNDKKLTIEKFQYNEDIEQRIYKTGDRGAVSYTHLELFFQYWSAKEAYLKAIGVGLLKGMSFFSVKDGVIKENGRKKDHWKLIPIKVQGYAAYIALKEKEKSGRCV